MPPGGIDVASIDLASATDVGGNLAITYVNGGGPALGQPGITLLSPTGVAVGSPILLPMVPVLPSWVTVGDTANGIIYLYDSVPGVGGLLVPPGDADAGVGDAGALKTFSFPAATQILNARALSDDGTAGAGGVGVTLTDSLGLSFAYVNPDTSLLGPIRIFHQPVGLNDYTTITHFGASFGVSLFDTATHSTTMASSGCP